MELNFFENIFAANNIATHRNTVNKNGGKMEGITLDGGTAVFYAETLTDLYNEADDDAAFIASVKSMDAPALTMAEFASPEYILEHAVPVVYGGEYAQDLISTGAYYEPIAGDIYGFYRCTVPCPHASRFSPIASYIIPESVVTDGKALKEHALKNCNVQLVGLMQMLAKMMGIESDSEEPNPPVYVFTATNQKMPGMFGAGVLLNNEALHDVHDKLGDFWILPSSVHETLVMSRNGHDAAELRDMVMSINAQDDIVPPDVKLSDNVFYFDGEKVVCAEVA